MALTRFERLLFPTVVLLTEVLFFVLYGTLVDYDEGGAPGHEYEVALGLANHSGEVDISLAQEYLQQLQSTRDTTKVYPFFQDVHVMVFIGFGFLMTFLRRYGFSSVGYNLFLAAFAIQWSTITLGLFSFIGQAQENADKYRILVSLESMVGSDFAAAAVLITFGSMLGRASVFQLFGIAFFELIFYAANEAVNIYVYKAADIGGSMLIHTFGAYFGLACSMMLYHRQATDHPRNSSVYHSDMFSMIGTLFLWLFWPSFNGALAEGNGQYRAVINTYFSLTGSVVASYLISIIVDGKRRLDMVHVQNATLAGGVAVGSVADMIIGPWGALLIGFISGVISVVGYKFLSPIMDRWLYLQDTCGVHNLHGLPGIFSGIASAIAAGVASNTSGGSTVNYDTSLYLTFPARAPETITDEELLLLDVEPGEGRSAGTQAGFQLALLVSTLAISIIGGLITGLIVRFIPCFQPLGEECFFDDEPFWQLPDDADTYLPVATDEKQQEIPNGHAPMIVELTEVIDIDNKESPIVTRKGVQVLPMESITEATAAEEIKTSAL